MSRTSVALKPASIDLTATTICRASLVLLDNALVQPPQKMVWPVGTEPFPGAVAGLYGIHIYIEDDELAQPLEDFCSNRLRPAIEAWAQDFRGIDLSGEYLRLPLGCQDAANERWHGVAMRCVIIADQPVGDRQIPSRWTRYYDVAQVEFKEGLCSMVVSLWVHTAEIEPHRLAPAA